MTFGLLVHDFRGQERAAVLQRVSKLLRRMIALGAIAARGAPNDRGESFELRPQPLGGIAMLLLKQEACRLPGCYPARNLDWKPPGAAAIEEDAESVDISLTIAVRLRRELLRRQVVPTNDIGAAECCR